MRPPALAGGRRSSPTTLGSADPVRRAGTGAFAPDPAPVGGSSASCCWPARSSARRWSWPRIAVGGGSRWAGCSPSGSRPCSALLGHRRGRRRRPGVPRPGQGPPQRGVHRADARAGPGAVQRHQRRPVDRAPRSASRPTSSPSPPAPSCARVADPHAVRRQPRHGDAGPRGRLPSREVAVLVSTLLVSARSGGSLVTALRDIADTLEARKETRREVRTDARAVASHRLPGDRAWASACCSCSTSIQPGTVQADDSSRRAGAPLCSWARPVRRRLPADPPDDAVRRDDRAARCSSRGLAAAGAVVLFVVGYRLMRSDALDGLAVEDIEPAARRSSAAARRASSAAASAGAPAGAAAPPAARARPASPGCSA